MAKKETRKSRKARRDSGVLHLDRKSAPRGLKRALKDVWEKSEVKRAVLDLPVLDILARDKECVLLLMTDTKYGDLLSWPPLMAWYPDEKLVGVVSNRLLPRRFLPMASCPGGLLCGINRCDIMTDLEPPLSRGPDDWPLRVAVCNPRTGFQLELPVVTVTYAIANVPEDAHTHGQMKMRIRGNQEKFSVFLLCTWTVVGDQSVYTWDSTSQVWKSSFSSGKLTGHLAGEFIFRDSKLQAYDHSTETWSAMAIPGAKAWNDFPLPQELACYTYRRVDPFRYGTKVIVVGQCLLELSLRVVLGGIVILELEEGGGGEKECERHWKVVSWAKAEQFANHDTRPSPLITHYPLVSGDLVVLNAQASWVLDQPVAFHLKHHTWLELPASSSSRLSFQTACIYNP